jgi:hypothetical protein
MRLIPTLAALFVTLCWLACIVGMFATSGPLALVWMVGVAVNGFCLVDLWADAYRAWVGTDLPGLPDRLTESK